MWQSKHFRSEEDLADFLSEHKLKPDAVRIFFAYTNSDSHGMTLHFFVLYYEDEEDGSVPTAEVTVKQPSGIGTW